jgi:hypothetical protein
MLNKMSERERLENDEVIAYIGGGRFGVLHKEQAEGTPTPRYTIRKIIEVENKDSPRAEWRRIIAERNSHI